MTRGNEIMSAMKWLATLGLALMLPAAHATTAVVFSESTGRWGVTWNEPNKQEAIEVATERCRLLGGGKDCKPVKVTDERGFGAVANTCAGNYCGISVITGRRSAAQAERDAIKDCNSYYGTKNCYVLDNWEETGAAPVAKALPPMPAPQPKPAAPTAKPAAAPVQSEALNGKAQKYDKACGLGDAGSCFNLGLLYDEGDGIRQDKQNAVKYFGKACGLGDGTGCMNLGFFYFDRQDKQKAIDYFGKGCELGEAWSCNQLGLMYSVGDGVRQDKKKALFLYDKSCSLDAEACKSIKKVRDELIASHPALANKRAK